MILQSEACRPRNRFVIIEEWIEDYNEEYDEDNGYSVYHIPVADTRSACGRTFAEHDRHMVWYFDELWDLKCQACWEAVVESGGSVPPQDPSYRTEAGYIPSSYGDGPSFRNQMSNYDQVGFSAWYVYATHGSRAEWDSLTPGEQRQVVLSAFGIRRNTGQSTLGGRAILDFRRAASGDGPLFGVVV